MSLRDDHAGLMGCARARDRNHSHSSGGGSMYAHNPSEQVRSRKAIPPGQTVFLVKAEKLLKDIELSFNSGVLMQYAG